MTSSEYGLSSARASDVTRHRLISDFTRWVRVMWRVYRQRAQLGGLDERALKDLGITAEQARAEAMRWPWDLPASVANGWEPGRNTRRTRFNA